MIDYDTMIRLGILLLIAPFGIWAALSIIKDDGIKVFIKTLLWISVVVLWLTISGGLIGAGFRGIS